MAVLKLITTQPSGRCAALPSGKNYLFLGSDLGSERAAYDVQFDRLG